ncbi:MAG: HAD family phosphatase [Clostridia bacterium]|nr:HAD family phosphatase [Clostridia bacterium]
MIKALFFDLDGTLLNSAKQIPASAREAITACRARGVRVFFATARSPRLDKTLGWTDADFALFDGGIYANGACICMDGHTHYSYIHPDAVRACIAAAAAYEDVHLSLHMPQEGYAFNFPVDASMNRSWGLEQARICAIDETAIRDTVKVLIFYDHLTDSVRPLPPSLGETIRQRIGPKANVYITDEGRTIQISGQDAGKLKAIERVRQKLGLAVEEVSVFGDDINDLEMISFYPDSVAMGNAAPQVKAAAGFVTYANDEGGVAYAISHYSGILNQENGNRP